LGSAALATVETGVAAEAAQAELVGRVVPAGAVPHRASTAGMIRMTP